MRIFYCDPGLSGDQGHHANSCRAIVGECRRRGIETHVLGHTQIEPALRAELGAQPLFRASTYYVDDGDPISGWLGAFSSTSNATLQDFRQLDAHVRAGDVIYVNSGQAAQFMALAAWMAGNPQPFHAVMEFGVDPGLDLVQGPNGTQAQTRDPREDPRAVLYRYAANSLAANVAPRLHLTTFESTSSQTYQLLLRQPVATLPNPRGRVTPPRLRGGGGPVTVAFLGHQRGEKGYQLVPEILAQLERRFPHGNVQYFLHNGEPWQLAEVQEVLRQFAARCPRCVLDERRADGALWAQLLDRSDLIVCPYMPPRFIFAYSALACDAIANGIPFIGPAGTTLEKLSREFGTGAAFAQWTADSIVAAIENVVLRFDDYAARAMAAAEIWPQQHGAGHCVEAILRLAGAGGGVGVGSGETSNIQPGEAGTKTAPAVDS
jgi:hypothetical protein